MDSYLRWTKTWLLAWHQCECYHKTGMIRAVFFDLYGTLAGFIPSRFQIQSTACAHFDIQVAPEGILRGYALADAYMAAENAVRPLRQRDPEGQSQFFAEYERLILEGAGVQVTKEKASEIWRHVRQVPYELARFEDVLPAMDLLKSRGLTLGLISNINRDSRELAEDLGLTPYLDFAVTSVEVGAEKPHPPIFLAALNKAGAQPGEAVHVGDQPSSDIEGARGVGINAVLLDRDGNHKDIHGCPHIESLMELPGLLASY